MFKKLVLATVSGLALAATAHAAGPAVLMSQALVDPSGNDLNKEWVELIATQSINFASTPFSVVVANNGAAVASGWIAGGATTYGFNITSGSVNAGDVFYVGGSGMVVTGTKLRVIDITTTNGDGFGTKNATAGVFGNGGANADGIAVFSGLTSSLTATSTPVDAIFYGTGIGTAAIASGGYQLPVNDVYSGGTLKATSFFTGSGTSGQVITATGSFNSASGTFTTARTWTAGTFSDDGLSSVSVSAVPEPGTTAMLVAGLAAVGFVARRRRQHGE